MKVDCWGTEVVLPDGCTQLAQRQPSSIMQFGIPEGTRLRMGELRVTYDLLFDVVDGVLFIQRPSLTAASPFGMQLHHYLVRMNMHDRVDWAGPGRLFKLGAGDPTCLCADYTIFDKQDHEAKLRAALAAGKSIAEGVRVFMTLEFHLAEDDEAAVKAAVKWQAQATGALAVGIIPVTGVVFEAYLCDQQVKEMRLVQPRFIDVGAAIPELPHLKLYLSGTPLWPHPCGHDFNLITYSPRALASLLVKKILASDLEMAYEIINYYDDPDQEDPITGKLPLVAALELHMAQIEAQASASSPSAAASMMQSLQKAKSKLVVYLLENGASSKLKDRNGVWALLYAKANKLEGDLFAMLMTSHRPDPAEVAAMKANVDLDAEGKDVKELGAADLQSAVTDGQLQLVELLLKLGISPNARCDGDLPLNIAVTAPISKRRSREGRKKMVEALLLQGANPRLPDERGLTALQLADQMKDEGIIQLLRRHS